jgi:peptide/nickel transport system substrate-binding protein
MVSLAVVKKGKKEEKTMGRCVYLAITVLVISSFLLGCAQATPATEPAKPGASVVATTPAAPAVSASVVAKPADTKPGRHLIGKLEGPEIITDPAKFPKKFSEAPPLAEMVKTGKLPPVEKRLPEDPMVTKPLHQIGKYGGTWRRAFTGPADAENMNRVVATDKLVLGDYTGVKYVPSLAKDYKVSDDGLSFTIYLRKGVKWSDGQPFTASDIMFWYEDLLQNKDLTPVPPFEMLMGGKLIGLEKIDDYTVVFKFPSPNYLWEEILAMDSLTGMGQAMGGSARSFAGGYAPAHYLKQFHAKYTPKEQLDQKIRDGKFDNWVSLIRFKHNWTLNTELPVLTPWKTVNPANTPNWILERNPYYWEVDTEGNQLPYIDKISLTLAENLEVLNLRAAAGEYDYQGRHEDLGKLPVLLENQQKGGYKVYLDPADHGCDACLFVNQSFNADPEIGKWLTNADFRRALSMAIDRDQLNEVFWLGTGTPGSPVVADNHPFNPGPEYRKLWSSFDLKKANELLDKTGLDKKDSEGYRLRTDGKGRLRIELASYGAQFLPLPQIGEMIREHWKKAGIDAEVKEIERGLMVRRASANELHIQLGWGNTGSENPFTRPEGILPVGPDASLGPEFGRWFSSGGVSGRAPSDPQLLRAYELLRSAPGLKRDQQANAAKELWRILIDQQYTIGTVGIGPATMGVRVVKTTMGNIPERLSVIRPARYPGAAHPATFFFK